jgi:FMN phosphatase YigB (HAD superfamily)
MKTLLVDLDGTLVRLRGEKLLEARLAVRGARRFADVIPRLRFHGAFWRAARVMQSHTTERTNYDVLVGELAREAGRPDAEIAQVFEEMVTHDFPAMGWHFQPIPGAREALMRARDRGHRLVLATNPVWPERAVRMRLAWGGLGDVEFDFVTHSGIMTRCKPNTHYYREVLRRLALRADQCVMIGDNPRKDLPAAEIGIRTFLLGQHGTLADLDQWLTRGTV